MKKLLIIPLLLISYFGFSQIAHIDTLLTPKGKILYDTTYYLGIQGSYIIRVDSTTIGFDSSLVVTHVVRNGDNLDIYKGGIFSYSLPLLKNADSIKHLFVDTSSNRNGYVLTFDSTNHKWYLSPPGTGGGGGGTVTSVSDLSPLFTTTNPTTNATFSLSNAAAYTLFGNNTGSTGAPSYFTNNFADSLKVSGDSLYRKVNGGWYYQFGLRNNDTAFIRLTADGLGVSPLVFNKGLMLRNTTADPGSAPQMPPALILEGQARKTTATAASQNARWIYTFLPVAGGAAPTGILQWFFAANNAVPTQDFMRLNSIGPAWTVGPWASFAITINASNGTISSANALLLSPAALSAGNMITYGGNNHTGSVGTNTYRYHLFNGTFAPSNSNVTDLFTSIEPIINNQGTKTGHYEALRINVTETSVPSGANRLISAGTGGGTYTEKFSVDPTGVTSLYKGADVASATTITITGNLFHVTGTTSITSVSGTGVSAGATIKIIFDGVLTFTDGSNLKLAGDFVTTADDTITLVYDGTNWYESARSVN